MANLGYETLPKELGTYRVAQGIHRDTQMHLDSQDLDWIWVWIQVVERGLTESSIHVKSEREERKKQGLLTREEWRDHQSSVANERGVAAEEGESLEETERELEQRGEMSLASGSGRENFFKTRLWAHRTVYSACPVHTRQRTGKRSSTRAAGAPDCPVSPDRGNFEFF
jgi:hypothetical protein